MPKKQGLRPVERAALAYLKRADPLLYAAAIPHRGIHAVRIRPKRRNDHLFASLAKTIVAQQLQTHVADTIWARVKTACGGRVDAVSVATTPSARLRRAGLSGSKVKTFKALAKEVRKEGLDLRALASLPHDEAAAQLQKVWGIGPWTTDMFLMFSLGAPDVFSPGDLGLVRAMEKLYGLPRNVSADELHAIALRWSPHRTYACLVLWEHYDMNYRTPSLEEGDG